MSNWTELLLNPQPLQAIFGADEVTLDGVDLHEVLLYRDGPSVTLRFDLAGFPALPPRKWAEQGLNRVQVQLELSGVGALSIQGWPARSRIDLVLERRAGHIALSGYCGEVSIDLLGQFVQLKKVSAYLDG